MVDFSILPIELINIIINYTDIIVYRNGKYLNRISKSDERYNIIKKRKLPFWYGNNHWTFYFTLPNTGFAIDYSINNNKHYLTKRQLIKNKNGSISALNQKYYIFDKDGLCREIVNYIM